MVSPLFAFPLLLCAALACAHRAAAQPFGVGLKLGTTLTDAVSSVESASIPNSHTFIWGPYVELRLPWGFSIEGDALYYPGLYSNAAGGGSVWQFPILAKFKFLNGPVRPYIEGGPAYSHLSDVKTLPDLLHDSNYGITLGAGVEIKILALRISPEIRYNGVAFTNIQSPLGLFKSNHNQAVLQVGVGF
jgi:opacity protein-like surface antigen